MCRLRFTFLLLSNWSFAALTSPGPRHSPPAHLLITGVEVSLNILPKLIGGPIYLENATSTNPTESRLATTVREISS
jgi:hypothetical protein